MAEEFLFGAAGDLLKKVCSLAANEIVQAWGVKKDLKTLQDKFEMIQAVLNDAERQQVGNNAVQNWLGGLKAVAYDADDVLDEFQTEIKRRKIQIRDSIKSKVRKYVPSPSTIAFSFKMANKIKNINLSLEKLDQDKDKFNLNNVIVSHEDIEDRETQPSIGTNSNIKGREKEKSEIVKLLIESSSNQQTSTSTVSVLPIVGMGGLGKTTLAKLVFNDESIKNHFEPRIWVCVSDPFDVKNILKNILIFLKETNIAEEIISNKAALADKVQEKINGKRYLLVLDDVWNMDYPKWQDLQASLGRNNVCGSSIIITTRDADVASNSTVTFKPYYLPKLPEEECRCVFESLAFRIGGPKRTKKLEDIGTEIVRRCGGVPLAVNFLGNLLYSKKEEREWSLIQQDPVWNLPQGDNKIIGVLKLSYDHLSPVLKQCFSYCSIFPKDYEISEVELIRMWMAEGFLQTSRIGSTTKTMEDTGHDYFNTLKQRSFFEVAGEKYLWGENLQCYKMHDFVHDLALHVGGLECSISSENTSRAKEMSFKIRYLSVASKVPEDLCKAEKLRTFVLLRAFYGNFDIKAVLKLRCLRVLNLSRIQIEVLPNSIEELIHLRYLDLSGNTIIKKLPQSITRLYNLQTLNLHGCTELKMLPEGMWKLKCLRHLVLDKFEPQETPSGIGSLTNLQTFPAFVVGKKEEERGINQLRDLNDLRDELWINRLGNVRDSRDAGEASLKEKQYIRKLGLTWDRCNNSEERHISTSILEGLQPHENLQVLAIRHFPGDKLPSWMDVLFLPNLVDIRLYGCRRCGHLPPLGKLPKLEFLSIRGINDIKYIGKELYGEEEKEGENPPFPLLKTFDLGFMTNLEGWEEQLLSTTTHSFPSLTKFSIVGCTNVAKIPKFPSLTTLSIKHIPNISSGGLLSRNTSLECLCILGCYEVQTLPQEELQALASLKELEIKYCERLTCVPDLRHLTSLRSLVIKLCPNLKLLPEGLRFLSSLESLSISDFTGEMDSYMEDEIGRIVSLQYLRISKCKNMRQIPESMQCLTNLKSLSIWRCSVSEEQCEKERGKDWHKIAHIPHIDIRPQPWWSVQM